MSDIGREALLAPTQAQLCVNHYFDHSIFAQEQALIFKKSACYVGHEKLVPEVGDWRTLTHENAGRVLVHNENGVELLSNVCRHRQAIVLGGEAGDIASAKNASGNLGDTGGNIVCPVHRWTYSNQGRLIGAPHFPSTPCLNLQKFTLKNCHGLLFEGPRDPARDMAELFKRPEFDFSEYVLDHVEVHRCRYNWKTFIEVYLEDYHVGPFHPGLGQFVSCDNLKWEFSPHYSLQRVGVHSSLTQPGTDAYRRWHERLLEYRGGGTPDFGAIWVTYFPTHMIELYPHVVVLSTLHPVSPQETVNIVEFYYPEEIVAFERELVEAQRAAYMETALEDDEIGERMDAGRKALLDRGVNETGPYQSPLEDGMMHFHEWYRRTMSS
ncbi:MAG TPA: aromatic ring-hydroxylating dioxygenase subunit alpha [Paralcaligenes sp.]